MRFRVEASLGPKSRRQAATKPSRSVTTIGRTAPRTMSSIADALVPEPLRSAPLPCGCRQLIAELGMSGLRSATGTRSHRVLAEQLGDHRGVEVRAHLDYGVPI